MRSCTSSRFRRLCFTPRTVFQVFLILIVMMPALGIATWAILIDRKTQLVGFQNPHAPALPPLARGEVKAMPKMPDRQFDKTKAKEPPKQERQLDRERRTANAAMPPNPPRRVRSFRFTIDPNTPMQDLLPPPPKNPHIAGPASEDDLSRVVEVQLEAPLGLTDDKAMEHIAHRIAKINHLNEKKSDGFIDSLRGTRTDLIGLPFAMGDACRSKGERSKQFALAVAMVRQAMPSPANNNPPAPEKFWAKYQDFCTDRDKHEAMHSLGQRESAAVTRIAALTQILMPMTEMHPGLVKYLSTIARVEATRALARLAIFSSEEEVRKAAISALSVRRERDYTEILVRGLHYPWPAVARRAAEAIAKLDRRDLLPQLIGLMEEDDPRSPVKQNVNGKEESVVRELVRVNHHRNCLLCHAPGNTGKVSKDAVTAGVPVPGQPLSPPSGGYNNSQPDILVRVDVTYLRQDFSAFQAVADANPWPEMQRFDFLVRTRVLSEEEATAYREKLKLRQPGEFSPYQRAAVAALREMTGRDTEPTPAAWRRLLHLPTNTQSKTETP
jgi:hypothetical protein